LVKARGEYTRYTCVLVFSDQSTKTKWLVTIGERRIFKFFARIYWLRARLLVVREIREKKDGSVKTSYSAWKTYLRTSLLLERATSVFRRKCLAIFTYSEFAVWGEGERKWKIAFRESGFFTSRETITPFPLNIFRF